MHKEPYVLIIRAGPVWGPRTLGFVADTFGSAFDGELISWAHNRHDVQHGRFRQRLVRLWRLPFSRLFFTLRLVLRGVRARWLLRRPLVVISYDPFQSGLAAVLIKYLTGARFICEVNGIYWHPDTFIDLPDRAGAEAKQRRMVRFGAAILKRADVVKLLYPGQLEGFRLDRPVDAVSFPDIVDSGAFVPAGRQPGNRIIFVGHPYLLKGVDLLLDAFDALREEFPDWRLLLVGYDIEKKVRARGFPADRVELLGPQPPAALRDLIEDSAVLVLPSRSEGMGRVLLEAALLGRPRIGSTVGGIPYVIEHGVDGLIFESGNAEALADALRQLMGSPETARTMGEQARARALRDFTREAFLARYRKLIAPDTEDSAAPPGSQAARH